MFNLLRKWNTLRNQILFVFLSVMIVVLLFVSILIFNQVSSLLENNAEKQIQQVAVEANGRIETLYEQLNMASKLVATNDKVQKLLTKEYDQKHVAFQEKQDLMGTVNTITANSDGIFSFQLFTRNHTRILPLDNANLMTSLDTRWVKKADDAKGSLVWIGEDPNDSNYFLVIRRVNLINRSFANGGYLLFSIYGNYFKFANQALTGEINQYFMLLDELNKPIITNFEQSSESIVERDKKIVQINERDYMITKNFSNVTGWTVLILTPFSTLTKGITVVRTSILLAGFIGLLIYFICSFFLSNIITRPIIRLTNTMRFASEGSLPSTPNISSVNEINELNSTYNQLVKETNHLITMVYQKEIIRSRSELRALQAQINPHFLFNTLDALHWTLEEKEEEELAELVVTMSNLFRYTISRSSEEEWVRIKDEIEHIEDYMEIMKMRFGEQLKWHIKLPQAFEEVRIPKFLIQPLVENAVLHGAENKLGQCTVDVIVEQAEENNRIRVSVRDDGIGINASKLKSIKESMEKGGITSAAGKGMALSNVYKRLALYYQDRQQKGLIMESSENKGTLISFEIPKDGGMSE
ncbi:MULTISPECIES: sensor histidine kinase [Bacillaceae]|jgi:two-component system, sensor histidine kinase YesM|uniref:sensor histidine kinase n=3 Tax=Bacillales TaxID=1385 RepID=UPI0004E1E3BA|nr:MULTISPECIES: sensor histidine kinase [Bacillaceae]MCF2648676.1 sensor histidine kinase [Niallia circulans]